MERGQRRESSAEISRHQGFDDLSARHKGFDERSARIFCAGSPPHSREIPEDPDSASKRQQWKTNDEDSTDIEEYVEYPSAHWMDGSSLRITTLL